MFGKNSSGGLNIRLGLNFLHWGKGYTTELTQAAA